MIGWAADKKPKAICLPKIFFLDCVPLNRYTHVFPFLLHFLYFASLFSVSPLKFKHNTASPPPPLSKILIPPTEFLLNYFSDSKEIDFVSFCHTLIFSFATIYSFVRKDHSTNWKRIIDIVWFQMNSTAVVIYAEGNHLLILVIHSMLSVRGYILSINLVLLV